MMSKRFLSATAVGMVLAATAGPAASQNAKFTIQVPVKVERVLVDEVSVWCRLYNAANEAVSALGHNTRVDVENGALDAVVAVEITVPVESAWAARTYKCELRLNVPAYSITPTRSSSAAGPDPSPQ